jgi:hypothetical protein
MFNLRHLTQVQRSQKVSEGILHRDFEERGGRGVLLPGKFQDEKLQLVEKSPDRRRA